MAQVPSSTRRRDVLKLEEAQDSDLEVLNQETEVAIPPTKQPAPAAPSIPPASRSEPTSTDEDEEFPEDYPDFFPTDMSEYLAQTSAATILRQREGTRGRLAIIYTIATFLMFILGFVVACLDAALNQTSIITNLEKILPLLSGIFLGTLGFVLGYYFRQMEDEETARTIASMRNPSNP